MFVWFHVFAKIFSHPFCFTPLLVFRVDKFLKRIVRPDIEIDGDQAAASVHDYTHGINSDPVTLMAIVLSAMIHDSDHRGVSNAQLIVEEPAMGDFYRGKSVAEQNSLDLSWSLLMSPEFSDLRVCMFGNTADMLRFRQIVVNVVLATDIFDKELNNLRKERWNEAFQEGQKCSNFNELRATIVIEHMYVLQSNVHVIMILPSRSWNPSLSVSDFLPFRYFSIQASDVAHTMQHWHVYRKWNERLFTEMYQAFRAGRMAKDPSTFWYQGEIGFFDNVRYVTMDSLRCHVELSHHSLLSIPNEQHSTSYPWLKSSRTVRSLVYRQTNASTMLSTTRENGNNVGSL